MVKTVKLQSDEGKGRAFIVLTESSSSDSSYAKSARDISSVLQKTKRVLSFSLPKITNQNWKGVAEQLTDQLAELKVRQASLVSFGDAGAVAQYRCLTEPKSVRTAVFVDATTRPHPTAREKFLDTLERFLPLGLPFRLKQEGFYASPFLQRLRCPIMVVTSPGASPYLQQQAESLSNALPTSWRRPLENQEDLQKLPEEILAFQDVPAKCPQKNLAANE